MVLIITINSEYQNHALKEGKSELADKPDSVVDSHSSRRRVTAALKQPTRERRGPRQCSPIWSCSEWGLPAVDCYQRRGALLPHPFTLTVATAMNSLWRLGGLLSVALAVGSRPPGVTWHSALWSPDFPPCPKAQRLSSKL